MVQVAEFPAGSAGLLASLALAVAAPNQNTLEGCFHFYSTSETTFPGQLRCGGCHVMPCFAPQKCIIICFLSLFFNLICVHRKCAFLRSTGTEDEFLSSYYFDLGPFFGLSAGLFYAESGDGVDPLGAQSAMYRTYQVPCTSAFLLQPPRIF